MVRPECRLETVDGLAALTEDQTGVVDQHVQAGRELEDLLCAAPDRSQVGQVEHDQLHPRRTVEARRQLSQGRPALVGVARVTSTRAPAAASAAAVS